MIESLCVHLLDILQAPGLTAGGNAWAAGWPGYTRNSAQAGYVNLFDRVYEPEGSSYRPAIYCGSRAQEADDRLETRTISASGAAGLPAVNEFRILIVPLILAVQGDGMQSARQGRNQLRANVKKLLYAHRVEAGFWYDLEIPGLAGGGALREHVTLSSTAQAGQGVAEGIAIIPVQMRYSWTPASLA